MTTLSTLHRADGSASYSSNGYSIVGAVNGPIEVQRRDELPEEAAIDVVIRPAAGVGGLRERHLITVLQSTLRRVIVVSAYPRTLIQLTLQIITTPGDGSSNIGPAISGISIIPALLQTAILALLSTSIPLSTTLTATLTSVNALGNITVNPALKVLEQATSHHVMAFTSHGNLLLEASEGDFSLQTWEMVHGKAREACLSVDETSDNEDVDMDPQKASQPDILLKRVVRENICRQERWKRPIG